MKQEVILIRSEGIVRIMVSAVEEIEQDRQRLMVGHREEIE